MLVVLLVVAIAINVFSGGRGTTLFLCVAAGVFLLGNWLWRWLFASAPERDDSFSTPLASRSSAGKVPFLYVLLIVVVFALLSFMMGPGPAAFFSIPLALLFGKIVGYSEADRDSQENIQNGEPSAEQPSQESDRQATENEDRDQQP